MSKAVLISIRPEWVEKILNGEKTLEVRKTRPNMETPFKCYIYCTKNEKDSDRLWVLREQIRKEYDGLSAVCAHLRAQPDLHSVGNGYVVGEFVCDRIESVFGSAYLKMPESAFAGSCLNMHQIDTYLDGKDGHFWHISDLKIYETPKELTEFHTWKKCKSCSKSGYESTACIYDENCIVPAVITKAPQSWCYVEDWYPA